MRAKPAAASGWLTSQAGQKPSRKASMPDQASASVKGLAPSAT